MEQHVEHKDCDCWDVFISFSDENAMEQSKLIYWELRKKFKVWHDTNPEVDTSAIGIQEGVDQSAIFLMVLTRGVFRQHFCLLELEQALESNKPVIFVHEAMEGEAKFEFPPQCWDGVAKSWHRTIQTLLTDNESIRMDSPDFYDHLNHRISELLANGTRFMHGLFDVGLDSYGVCRDTAECEHREWAFQMVDMWSKEPVWRNRCFALQGKSGNGKTVVASSLVKQRHWAFVGKKSPENVLIVGCFFFQHNSWKGSDPRSCLYIIGKQLCEHFGQDYEAAIKNLDKATLDNEEDLLGLFRALIAQPCSKMVNSKRLVILIDGAEECAAPFANMFNLLLQNHWLQETPQWLGLILTGTQAYTAKMIPHAFNANLDDHESDISVYFMNHLSDHVVGDDNVDDTQGLLELVRDMAEILVGRCDQTFICAKYMRNIASDCMRLKRSRYKNEALRLTEVQDVDIFPQGMDAVLVRYFSRLLKVGFKDDTQLYRNIMSALAASREKLPLSVLESVLSRSECLHPREHDHITKLGSVLREAKDLIQVKDGFVSFGHQSVRDWILGLDMNHELAVNLALGNHILAGWSFVERNAQYAYRHVIYHLCHADSAHKVPTLLFDFGWIYDALNMFDVSARELAREAETWFLTLGRTDLEQHECDLVVRALVKSATALDIDPEQLAAQLMARIRAPHPILDSIQAEWSIDAEWVKPISCHVDSAHSYLYKVLKHPVRVKAVAMSRDLVATACEDGVRLWGVGGHVVQMIPHPGARTVAVNNSHVISGGMDGCIIIASIHSGEIIHELRGYHQGIVHALSVDGKNFASAGNDGLVALFSIEHGALLHGFLGDSGKQKPFSMKAAIPDTSNRRRKTKGSSISSSGSTASGGSGTSANSNTRNRSIKGLRESFRKTFSFGRKKGKAPIARAVALSGDLVASGGVDMFVYIWSARSGTLLHALTGHIRAITSLAIENDTLVSSSDDCTIRTWTLSAGEPRRILGEGFDGHCLSIQGVDASNDLIVSGGLDNDVFVWDDLGHGHVMEGHTHYVNDVCVLGDRVASAGEDKTVRIWSATAAINHDLDKARELELLQAQKKKLAAKKKSNAKKKRRQLPQQPTHQSLPQEQLEDLGPCVAHKVAFHEHRGVLRVVALNQESSEIRLLDPEDGRLVKYFTKRASAHSFGAYLQAFDHKGEFDKHLQTYTRRIDRNTTTRLFLRGMHLDIKIYTKQHGIWRNVIGFTFDAEIVNCDCTASYIALTDKKERVHILKIVET